MGQARYDKHSAEFRAEAVRLARVARELGVKESTLRRGEGRPA
jgi:transposase-like protein